MTHAIDTSPQHESSVLAAGDASASAGDWVAAVGAWERGLATVDATASTERIRWFLDQAGDVATGPIAPAPEPTPRGQLRRLLAAMAVLSIGGTACVLAGQDAPGVPRNIMAALAWLAYVAAAALAIAYAFVSSRPAESGLAEATPLELRRARRLAVLVEQDGLSTPPHIAAKISGMRE